MVSRILAIDDDQDILELYSLFLQEEGYETHLSTQVFQDIAEVERLHPDLIILDALIGRADDGLLLIEKLKQHTSTSHIPLILCTAAQNIKSEHEDMLRQTGVTVIDKPFDLVDLGQAIQHRLAESLPTDRVS